MPIGTNKNIRDYFNPTSQTLNAFGTHLEEGPREAATAAIFGLSGKLWRAAAQRPSTPSSLLFFDAGRRFVGLPTCSPGKLRAHPALAAEPWSYAPTVVGLANALCVAEIGGSLSDGVIHVCRRLAEQLLLSYDCEGKFAPMRIDEARVLNGLRILLYVETKVRGHGHNYLHAFGPDMMRQMAERDAWPQPREGHAEPDCLFMDLFTQARSALDPAEMLLLAEIYSQEAARAHARLAKVVDQKRAGDSISDARLKQLIDRTTRDWEIKTG